MLIMEGGGTGFFVPFFVLDARWDSSSPARTKTKLKKVTVSEF